MDSTTEALIGIDPDDTTVVEYGGGKFTIGVLPVGQWDILNTQLVTLLQNARRTSIAKLAADGVNAEELVYPDKEITRLDAAIPADMAYRTEMPKLMIRAIKYGLRDFTNFKSKTGKAFEFCTEKETVEGEVVTVVAPSTLRIFRANYRLLQHLWRAFSELNTLSVEEKKA